MCIRDIHSSLESLLDKLRDTGLLFLRLALAYGFYTPAMSKWADIGAIADWFGSMGMPFPTLNAYMATTTEIVGVVLLVLGLMVRVISLPLIVVMIVAIATVHLPHGFEAGNNGFEIPLYYILMLIVLATHGGGKYGIDRLWTGKTDTK